jgi:4-alpha-glucanotransferase
MQRAGLMSCRVLYFERAQDDGFLPPPAYPRHALVSVSTHDLPTLKGYWTGRDVRWRELLRRFPDEAALQHARGERERDRGLLLQALARAGLLPDGLNPEQRPDALSNELVVAVHRYLAQTPGYLLMVQLEDALGEEEQPNLPGTDEHPNWRRKLGSGLEELPDLPLMQRLAEMMAATGRAVRR